MLNLNPSSRWFYKLQAKISSHAVNVTKQVPLGAIYGHFVNCHITRKADTWRTILTNAEIKTIIGFQFLRFPSHFKRSCMAVKKICLSIFTNANQNWKRVCSVCQYSISTLNIKFFKIDIESLYENRWIGWGKDQFKEAKTWSTIRNPSAGYP